MNSDSTLVQKAATGDRAAYQLLLERHYDMIYRVAYRFTGHAQSAEDVAQDVCVSLVDKLKSFRGDSAFSTWIYRIIVNACRDMQRKQSSHQGFDRS